MPSEEMSFWDHLDVLRSYIIRVLVVLAVVLVGCFFALPYIFDPFILGPTHADFSCTAPWVSPTALRKTWK